MEQVQTLDLCLWGGEKNEKWVLWPQPPQPVELGTPPKKIICVMKNLIRLQDLYKNYKEVLVNRSNFDSDPGGQNYADLVNKHFFSWKRLL